MFISGPKAEVHEESWNAGKFVKTVSCLPNLFQDKFSAVMETVVVEDDRLGEEENIFKLGDEDLENREIVRIDIAAETEYDDTTFKDDPTKFKSAKTGRGPLDKDWETKTNPIICIYILFIVDLDISDSLVPKKLKSFVIRTMTKGMNKYHRKLFCSMDEWVDLTMEDIRELEKECAELLPQEMNKDTKKDATAFN